MHPGLSQLVKQDVLIVTPIHVQFNLVMVARLAIWVIVGSCMKATNLGLMLINLVVLSLDQHQFHLPERKSWIALRIFVQFLVRIHLERNQQARTCGLKWKEFKSTLKKHYFDETITDAQLKAMYADRVTDADWAFLSNYWKSPASEVRNN